MDYRLVLVEMFKKGVGLKPHLSIRDRYADTERT
jgi:hypothetical protein